MSDKLSRRRFLRGVALLANELLEASCQPKVVKETVIKEVEKVVKETVIVAGTPKVVEKVVKETVVVEVPAKPAPGERPQVTLRFWNWWARDRVQLMNAIIEDFQTEFPWIDVQNHLQTWDRRDEKVLTAIASGDVPEVIMATTVEVLRFAHEGRIIPIDPYIEKFDIDLDRFYAAQIAGCNSNVKQYTMPMPTGGGLTGYLLYNKDVFTQAGLDPEKPPETWQDMETAARAITEFNDDGSIKVLGTDVGRSGGPFGAWLYCNAGEWINEDRTKVTFNSEEGVDTLQWQVRFTDEINGGTENVADFYQRAEASAAGEPVYIGTQGWNYPNVSVFFHIQNLAPDLNWGLGLRPYNSANPKAESHGVAGLSFGWGYVIPTGLDRDTEEAAALWVKRITYDEEACWFMAQQSRPTPIKECNEVPEYYDMNPYWSTVLEGLDRDVVVPIVPVHTEMASFLNQAVEEAMFHVREPKEALDWAAEQAQEVLDDFWSEA